jgi:hypothetical protein
MLFIILGIAALLVLGLPLTASIAIALTKGMGLKTRKANVRFPAKISACQTLQFCNDCAFLQGG